MFSIIVSILFCFADAEILTKKLGDEEFEVREKTSLELSARLGGPNYQIYLTKLKESNKDPEIVRRTEELLDWYCEPNFNYYPPIWKLSNEKRWVQTFFFCELDISFEYYGRARHSLNSWNCNQVNEGNYRDSEVMELATKMMCHDLLRNGISKEELTELIREMRYNEQYPQENFGTYYEGWYGEIPGKIIRR